MERDELLARISDLIRRSEVQDGPMLLEELEAALSPDPLSTDPLSYLSFESRSPGRIDFNVNREIDVVEIRVDWPGQVSTDWMLLWRSLGLERARWPMPKFGIFVRLDQALDPDVVYGLEAVPVTAETIPSSPLRVTFGYIAPPLRRLR